MLYKYKKIRSLKFIFLFIQLKQTIQIFTPLGLSDLFCKCTINALVRFILYIARVLQYFHIVLYSLRILAVFGLAVAQHNEMHVLHVSFFSAES